MHKTPLTKLHYDTSFIVKYKMQLIGNLDSLHFIIIDMFNYYCYYYQFHRRINTFKVYNNFFNNVILIFEFNFLEYNIIYHYLNLIILNLNLNHLNFKKI